MRDLVLFFPIHFRIRSSPTLKRLENWVPAEDLGATSRDDVAFSAAFKKDRFFARPWRVCECAEGSCASGRETVKKSVQTYSE